MAMKEFIDDIAFDTLVDSLGEAFTTDLSSNKGSSALLDQIMAEHLADPEKKANFTVDLMQNDEMLTLGLLGDDFESLQTQPEYA